MSLTALEFHLGDRLLPLDYVDSPLVVSGPSSFKPRVPSHGSVAWLVDDFPDNPGGRRGVPKHPG